MPLQQFPKYLQTWSNCWKIGQLNKNQNHHCTLRNTARNRIQADLSGKQICTVQVNNYSDVLKRQTRLYWMNDIWSAKTWTSACKMLKTTLKQKKCFSEFILLLSSARIIIIGTIKYTVRKMVPTDNISLTLQYIKTITVMMIQWTLRSVGLKSNKGRCRNYKGKRQYDKRTISIYGESRDMPHENVKFTELAVVKHKVRLTVYLLNNVTFTHIFGYFYE